VSVHTCAMSCSRDDDGTQLCYVVMLHTCHVVMVHMCAMCYIVMVHTCAMS